MIALLRCAMVAPLASGLHRWRIESPEAPSSVRTRLRITQTSAFEVPTVTRDHHRQLHPSGRAGRPGLFNFDPNALYSIYVDNTGDGEPDVTFFQFKTTIANPNTFLAHLGTAGPGGGDAVISSLFDADFNSSRLHRDDDAKEIRFWPLT
jgi:hypothetical protein